MHLPVRYVRKGEYAKKKNKIKLTLLKFYYKWNVIKIFNEILLESMVRNRGLLKFFCDCEHLLNYQVWGQF